MKVRLIYIALFTLAIFLIPLIALGYTPLSGTLDGEKTPVDVAPANLLPSSVLPDAVEIEIPPPEAEDFSDDLYTDNEFEHTPDIEAADIESVSYESSGFKILDLSTGRVHEVSARDYVRGAVASEMPASFHIEAMKAQAVAAHTYALHHQLTQRQNPDPALRGADFSADPSNLKGYMTEAAAREFYGGGDTAVLYWDKICEATDSVLDLVMEYDDEPIVAAYHAISAGRTEDASNVWSGEAPYLRPAESPGDILAPGYESLLELDSDEVKSILLAAYPEMELDSSPEYWFTDTERSESGYVTCMDVGGLELHGKEVRELFGLRSHNIEIETHGDTFYFFVHGYGHGVGLSQYGADFMARQGYSFDEILTSYYTGVNIRRIGQ